MGFLKSIFGLESGALGGIWGYVAAFGVGAVIAASAAGWLTATVKDAEIATLKQQHAEQAAAQASAALDQFVANAGRIDAAAQSFAAISDNLGTSLEGISKELHDAQKAHPLPVDCRPDPGRVRALTAAIAAANSAARPQPGRAVPPASGSSGR